MTSLLVRFRNMSELLVSRGLATVIRHRVDVSGSLVCLASHLLRFRRSLALLFTTYSKTRKPSESHPLLAAVFAS
jgi:hypothetical protein